VAGTTGSSESSFPVTVGPDLTMNGEQDAFVARVSADGSCLEYCGYIGGELDDNADDITVDDLNRAYVIGSTSSTEASFPVVGGPDLTHNGNRDVFVAKVTPLGAGLLFCGYVGGTENDNSRGIAVDGAYSAYLTGTTESDETSFPVVVGPDLIHNGDPDVFVAKLDPSGEMLAYCGYIGGDLYDWGGAIAVDGMGAAYVTGWTESDETTFPVIGGPDLTFNGLPEDAFVAKVSPPGVNLIYCGYIGGEYGDQGRGIAVDDAGRAFIAGLTGSTETTFPVVNGPDLSYNGGTAIDYGDAFVAGLNSAGTLLKYCGYIGGVSDEYGYDIALDNTGTAYVTGYTQSTETSFPLLVGPDLTHNGDDDVFVAKVSMALVSSTSKLSASTGGVVGFDLHAGLPNGGRNHLLLGGLSGISPGTPLPGGMATLPLNWDSFTNLVLSMLSTPYFTNFLGMLDPLGSGMAQMNTMGPLPASAIGLTLSFAFALDSPWDFASNPVHVDIGP
jgi:hypothetical protein